MMSSSPCGTKLQHRSSRQPAGRLNKPQALEPAAVPLTACP